MTDVSVESTAREMLAALSSREMSCSELMDLHLARISERNPELNAIVSLDEERARDGASEADRTPYDERGPLHGLPWAFKDTHDVAGWLTTYGSPLLADNVPDRDELVVERIRRAGAVPIGKTNVPEFAAGSHTFNTIFGTTRNPVDPTRSAGGSSGGAACALASGMVPLAEGSDMGGSLRNPASFCGVYGLRPSRGRVPAWPSENQWEALGTSGPMARTVSDAAVLLSVMAGIDVNDQATAQLKGRPVTDFTAALQPDALRGARIGVARNLAGFHEGVDAVFDQSVARLTAAGAVVVDPANLELSEEAGESELVVLLYEFKDGLNRYLAGRPGAPQTLAEVIAFNERERARELPYFGQELFLQAEAKGPLTDKAYRHARDVSLAAAGRDGIDAVLRKYKLDALIAPTVGPAWTTDLINGDHFLGGDASSAPAIAGYPHITVPAGFVHGLPVGLSFIGSAWSEATLIGLAYAFEQATLARRAPDLPATGWNKASADPAPPARLFRR